MKKLILFAGLAALIAAPAMAGKDRKHDRNSRGYDMHVIADEDSQSAIYVINHGSETVAVEVAEDEDALWLKDSEGLKALDRAEDDFTDETAEDSKGFTFSAGDEDVHIAFSLPFWKHVSIRASEDDDEAHINVTSQNGEGGVFVRALDGHAFISIMNADAKAAREFIDDIDGAPRSMRLKMKKELGLD